jgi:hypothetical protein
MEQAKPTSRTTEAPMISMSETPLIPKLDAPMPPSTEAPIIPLAEEQTIPEPEPQVIVMSCPPEPADARPTLREQITSLATRYLAGTIIAAPDFPTRWRMPKLLPPPFSNFGHQVLFDYQMLATMVWHVATQIRAVARDKHGTWWRWNGGIILMPLIMGIALALTAGAPLEIGLLFVAAAVPFVFVARTCIQWGLKRQIADIRADALERLIRDPLAVSVCMPEVPEGLIGNGELGTERVPVVTVMQDSHPFSGYGRLQAESLFVCRPKDSPPGRCSMAELEQRVEKRILDKVREVGLPETTFGTVAVLHGESLGMDSPWLDESKAPRLWLERDRLSEIHEIDARASVRVYFTTQIVFPQHMTAATFFVRLFPTGNGAAFQIAVATIGPPTAGLEYLTMRLLKHQSESNIEGSADTALPTHEPMEREGLAYLDFVEHVSEHVSPFQGPPDSRWFEDIDVDKELYRGAAYARRFDKVVARSVMWPGHYLGRFANFREANSLTFPVDFFGRPEAIASVRTVYDQLARAILDTLDENGFDISDYRDSEGRYAIHAEKIDQLIVGERIHMDASKKKSERESHQGSESANGTQKAAA